MGGNALVFPAIPHPLTHTHLAPWLHPKKTPIPQRTTPLGVLGFFWGGGGGRACSFLRFEGVLSKVLGGSLGDFGILGCTIDLTHPLTKPIGNDACPVGGKRDPGAFQAWALGVIVA